MHASERSIRKLRLHADDDSSVAPAVTLLEAAFRTASLPGIPQHRLVLVRYLDLGDLAIEASPVAAALRIDTELRRLAGVAICAEDYEVDDAGVVWFRDALQPYVTVARLLASGSRPRAWYWPAAAPGWRAAEDAGASVVAAIRAAAGTTAAVAGAARVAGALLETGVLDTALQSLTAADAAAILSASPHYPRLADSPAADDDAHRPPRLRAAWRNALAAWIRRWGPHDPRSACLVALALASELPTLAASRHSGSAMRRIIFEALGDTATPARRPMPQTGRHRRPAGDRRTAAQSDVPQPESATRPRTAPGPAVACREPGPAPTAGDRGSAAIPDCGDQRAGTANLRSSRRARHADARASAGERDPAVEFIPGETRIRDLDGLQRTDGAGLALLVPVLETIGIAEIIDDHEALAACGFPARVLWRAAERCGLEEDDPACAMLPAVPEWPDDARIDFVAPEAWRPLRASRASRATAAVIHRALDPAGQAELRRVENATLLIAARYLWRHAGIGLRSLVMRPGQVAVTPTWVDVAFAASDADIRIRRAGIDVDPGWVAWLGKVVQFHYRDGEAPGNER